jgi:PPM family protein phosphatase
MPYRAALPALPRLHLAARTTRGPMRQHNEDNYAIVELTGAAHHGLGSFAGARSIDTGIVLAVLDGMGGHSSGDGACRLALDGLGAALRDGPPVGVDERTAWLGEAVAAMSRAIWDEAVAKPHTRGMGATATVALVADGTLHLGHVGDTRCYLFREGRLVQMTRDDTLSNDARSSGLTPEELAQCEAQFANILTRALGVKDVVKPRTEAVPLRDGDVLLLASDGLYRAVDYAVIAETLRTLGDAGEAAMALESLAERALSSDNITVLVARVEGLRAPGPGDELSSRNLP